ncbi:MAG TPA: hypothetical protein VNZ47_05190 [Candidatus Dormibacteraeota bacterium]|jgi:hypothetical protein|nr:hypothetical protein [Candidatus Dormibacteraeota bacterium]
MSTDQSFFSDSEPRSRDADAPHTDVLGQDREPKYDGAGDDTCCILGVGDSGKTFLLAAIHQACMLSGEDGYRLSFSITDEDPAKQYKTSDLLREAVNCIVRGDNTKLRATTEWRDYSFHLSCRASLLRKPFWFHRPRSLNFRFVDGPGEAMFPQMDSRDPNNVEHRRKLISDLRRAKYLIVCVDALKPHLDVFHREYTSIVAEAAEPTAPYRLRADRALLLLTKIDAAVNAFVEASHYFHDSLYFSEKSSAWAKPEPSLALEYLLNQHATPRKIAEIIDPIEQARTVLSQQTVSTVRRLLKDSTQMAIGVCSSTGFHADGYPFWNIDTDSPKKESVLRLMKGQTRDDAYRNWVPFGVKEAILYLLTGWTGANIRNYSVDNDAKSSARRMFPISLVHDEPFGSVGRGGRNGN